MNDSNVESAETIDRLTSEMDDEFNQSGIVLERRPRARPLEASSRLLNHWCEHHVRYTSAATFLGIIFAFWQLSLSVKQFERQMLEQQESTSSQLVSDFFRQVGDMTAMASTQTNGPPGNKKDVERFIVSRAQMLIDSEQTRPFRNEIIRFLGANGYGTFIGTKPQVDEPGINLNSANLSDIRIYGADFSEASFFCVGFTHANIDRTKFVDSDINNTDFSDSLIGNVDFSSSRMRKVHFNNVTLIGDPTFKDASILHSDLTGLHLSESILVGLGKANDATSAQALKSVQYEYLAKKLSEAQSLIGTTMDSQLTAALEEIVGKENFTLMTTGSSDSQASPIGHLPDTTNIDYRANCKSALTT